MPPITDRRRKISKVKRGIEEEFEWIPWMRRKSLEKELITEKEFFSKKINDLIDCSSD